ncbi:major facilitator superfamily domain-containing protein [Podospora fimiseda]|uniref:Major facilitator superfamily domain-containing protein n=1 Tax=Podospora fimiseda TaxID=252190 RepID=A0AAN7H2G3_9PEZI|nr:major facilitator superfamily domain-containing protein [Podospora fimiseda]
MAEAPEEHQPQASWRSFFGRKSGEKTQSKWTMGILEDKETVEVPGSVLLLAPDRNEPLGLRNAPARTSVSSIPVGMPRPVEPAEHAPDQDNAAKRTKDGTIILDPQPDDSANDPLNWPAWRRDSALMSLGLFCMVGGGMTPILAAGFTDVAEEYGVDVHTVSLTTGLYMMGMGLGSVFFSPTAILYGKRPVYLFGCILFIVTSVWCAVSPNFASLTVARILQGFAVSPVECLPSATIAEIFFLHERAFRIGIYTLLLLGGKNLVPLVSAAVIQNLGWRWVFWIVAMIVGFCGILLFLFVPETFWDRAPRPRKRKSKSRPASLFRGLSRPGSRSASRPASRGGDASQPITPGLHPVDGQIGTEVTPPAVAAVRTVRVGFATPEPELGEQEKATDETKAQETKADSSSSSPTAVQPPTPTSPNPADPEKATSSGRPHGQRLNSDFDSESLSSYRSSGRQAYTTTLRGMPPQSFSQQLKPWNGRLSKDKWWKVALRPLILFSYPAVLWSAVVYSCSVGWLIVISESMAVIYREGVYQFDALQTGLVYISPFVGGILGTAVAGKVSDIIVKAMARRNGGLYEPEFRLVMAIPVAITTVIGLMGFGWSAEKEDHWMVPTAFFGIISFGCSLGSTTSITFCVDSYRQYAGEALVTLNFSKNIFHGLVFSLFVTGWIGADGPKMVYIWLGIIQFILCLFTIPMYIYGKRARMWTVRKNFMEKF